MFKRHCESTKVHSLKIYLVTTADSFARRDSLQRHRGHPPNTPASRPQAKANESRRENHNTQDELMTMLRGFSRTGEEMGMTFSQIIRDMYPDSSKDMRGSRGQN